MCLHGLRVMKAPGDIVPATRWQFLTPVAEPFSLCGFYFSPLFLAVLFVQWRVLFNSDKGCFSVDAAARFAVTKN